LSGTKKSRKDKLKSAKKILEIIALIAGIAAAIKELFSN